MLKFAQKLTAHKLPSFTELEEASDEQGRYELEEQAAILEYEAGFPREEAEAIAASERRHKKEPHR